MDDRLIKIEDAAASLLSDCDLDILKRELIEEKVRQIARIQGDYSEEDIAKISRRLEERFNISMSIGTMFDSEFRPWLDGARESIDWFYWARYRRFLINNNFSPRVVTSIDSITDQILDHLENPCKPGGWKRKGMVVGHVQSGKTANYVAVINKAADSGYKVIIVLAGLLNSLRSQTQRRIDSGFIGIDTSHDKRANIGVGTLVKAKSPAYFTTAVQDFKKNVANQIGVKLGDLKEPVVFVIKKHKSTLENLIDWLKNNNPHNLQSYPMLLIDDEADHASINTNKKFEQATTINRKIRTLLNLFNRSSYLGYTATPFANVFIDPESDDEMVGDDLFPRDFILTLDPPSNYMGSPRIFSDQRDLNIVREIFDHQDFFPSRHKKDWVPPSLPESLKEAIRVFILVRIIRILRGHKNLHNSMLINVSRFTMVQSHVKLLADEYLRHLREGIVNYYQLGIRALSQSNVIMAFKKTFDQEFNSSGFEWDEIQRMLKTGVSPVSVIEVNSSAVSDPLEYGRRHYPDGRNVIAVGGLSLSRGLTLEGLSVSYFLRNSVMYDTLMQMGRWFGYRDGYEELCRIYMTPDAFSWYAHISNVTDELREEFKRMKSAGMSPQDFGLCVRSHPESLIVTARNKMRSGKRVIRAINLEGRLVETSILLNSKSVLSENFRVLEILLKVIIEIKEFSRLNSNYFWSNVPANIIQRFVNGFENHWASQLTEKGPLDDYISWIASIGFDKWDVVLVSVKGKQDSSLLASPADLYVVSQERKVTYYSDTASSGIVLNKRRVASRGLEKIGLSQEQIYAAEKNYIGKNVPDHAYRGQRENPLLMLHLLDCRVDGKSIWDKAVVAYGISFPGLPGSMKPRKLVEYVVNTTWWQNEYFDLMDEDEAEENDV